MRVNRRSGGYCCMACGEKGGDVLAFHMRLHDLDFLSAARELNAVVESDKPYSGPTRARRIPAGEALDLLYEDSLLAWVAAGNLANGVRLTDRDRADLSRAADRVFLVSQEARP